MVSADLVDLEIVLPCYNPAKDWVDRILQSLFEVQEKLSGVRIRLIIVNDGSRIGEVDYNIKKILEVFPSTRYISYSENRGKGFAIRKGMEVTVAPIVIFTDIDFPFALDSLAEVYASAADDGMDITLSKRMDYDRVTKGQRKILSDGLKWFNRQVLGLKYPETQAGLKAFTQLGLQPLMRTKTDRYLFDLEMVCLAQFYDGLKITSKPVYLRKGVELPPISAALLKKEFISFIKLVFRIIGLRLFGARFQFQQVKSSSSNVSK